jgi:hypothetical protein
MFSVKDQVIKYLSEACNAMEVTVGYANDVGNDPLRQRLATLRDYMQMELKQLQVPQTDSDIIHPAMKCCECYKNWTAPMTIKWKNDRGLPDNCPKCYGKHQRRESTFLHTFKYL